MYFTGVIFCQVVNHESLKCIFYYKYFFVIPNLLLLIKIKYLFYEIICFKVVPNNFSIYLYAIFYFAGPYGKAGWSFIFCSLARHNLIICNCNPSKKKVMSISFFIVGGVIFTIYLFLMFWNIVYSNKKQKEKNYPNIDEKEVLNKNNNL